MPVNISNSKNRDAIVAFESLMPKRSVRYTDAEGRSVANRKLLKTDVAHDLPQLLKKTKKIEKIADALIKSDPEIDVEDFGMFLTDTSRVYVTEKGIVHLIEEFEVVKNPDGTVRERRPRKKESQNINTDMPLKWTGKFIKKKDAIGKFVFTNKKQLVHVNGLTFDFLFDMAKTLQKKDSLLLVRGGEEGKSPVIMNRGGKAYNAFLEGRVKGDSYCLILHLSNMELKKPTEASTVEN
ncbi:MAG: hypothetical protein WKF92_09075 [Pyrinomonadaceae bacterium]